MKSLCLLWLWAASAAGQTPVLLPEPTAAAAPSEPFEISTSEGYTQIYGRGSEVPRVFFQEFSPALFTRTLALDGPIPLGSKLD